MVFPLSFHYQPPTDKPIAERVIYHDEHYSNPNPKGSNNVVFSFTYNNQFDYDDLQTAFVRKVRTIKMRVIKVAKRPWGPMSLNDVDSDDFNYSL